MTDKRNRESFAPQIIAIIMLLWALNPENPYGYYILLRIVICFICGFLAFRALELGHDIWVWILGITAVIYNPIIRIHLTREIWSMINIATIVMLGVTFRTLRKRSASDQKRDETDEY